MVVERRHTESPPTVRYTTMALGFRSHQSTRSDSSRRRRTVWSHGRVVHHGNNIWICVIVDRTIIVADHRGRLDDKTEHVATNWPHSETPYCSTGSSEKEENRRWEESLQEQTRSHEHRRKLIDRQRGRADTCYPISCCDTTEGLGEALALPR
jgi:hypothetical protein